MNTTGNERTVFSRRFTKQAGTGSSRRHAQKPSFKAPSFLNMQKTLLLTFYQFLSAEKYPFPQILSKISSVPEVQNNNQ